jgi:hypothetical protein
VEEESFDCCVVTFVEVTALSQSAVAAVGGYS